MQYNGLGTLGVVLPELNNAAEWLEHAEVRLSSGSACMWQRVRTEPKLYGRYFGRTESENVTGVGD